VATIWFGFGVIFLCVWAGCVCCLGGVVAFWVVVLAGGRGAVVCGLRGCVGGGVGEGALGGVWRGGGGSPSSLFLLVIGA